MGEKSNLVNIPNVVLLTSYNYRKILYLILLTSLILSINMYSHIHYKIDIIDGKW